jgi:hypothetical protein
MEELTPRANLYVLFEGIRGDRRPVQARARAPRSGIKVRVAVEPQALHDQRLFLLYRKGDGDMVLGASAHRAVLEELRGKMGRAGDAYVIAEIPIAARA